MATESKYLETIEGFAEICYDLLHSDRDCTIGVAGFTGEGKSCFMSKLAKAYCKIRGIKWSWDQMTWSRRELITWIDGKGKSHAGRLPEYSVIVPDELIFMFFARRWTDEGQIEGIETFNTARDRHQLIIGGIPVFWSLDSAFRDRVRYYVYIPKGRSVAWVFSPEDNPFTRDPWNQAENNKWFRKAHNNPYTLPNFVCEIRFGDWQADEKAAYYAIRNVKRVAAKQESKEQFRERYGRIKIQRDRIIRALFEYQDQMERKLPRKDRQKLKLKHWTYEEIGDLIDLSGNQIEAAVTGRRTANE